MKASLAKQTQLLIEKLNLLRLSNEKLLYSLEYPEVST